MADLTGQTLGKYQILDRLGRGGMADVYKGYQPGLDRYVAVKVMHAHLSEDPDFITRFKREAKSVAELRHPNIVQVFDFDVQGEVYYMVMEHIEGGETLKQRLQKLAEQSKRLPIEQTLDIMIKLADALAYAHDKGMVHRDIKPANVLLPGLDRPVLSDFGIARLLGETGLTTSGAMIGTPAYMSPEQGRGERGDARSDIYSLGIVLYEMLTGKPPYDADTPFAIILKHINDPLTPPHILIDPMPDAAERIVLKCLAKKPDDRFASMAELREALRGAQSAIGQQQAASTIEAAAPTLAPIKPQPEVVKPVEPISAAAPATRSGGLKPAWLIGGVAGMIVVGLIIVLALASRGGAPQAGVEPTAQPAPATAAIGAQPAAPTPAPEIEATAITAAPAPAEVQTLIDQGIEQLKGGELEAARDLFTQALKAQPDNAQAHVGRALAELYLYGDMDQAAADLEAAAPVMADDPSFHLASGLLYRRSDKHHDLQAAVAEFTQALDQCGGDTAVCIAAYQERGQLYAWDTDQPQEALADFANMLKLSTDPYQQADIHAYQASVRYEALGDLPAASDDLQQAYELNQWPGYLEEAAKYAVRSQEYDQALDIYNQLLTAEKGDPRLLAGRAYVEWKAGDAETAQQSAERALQLDPKLLEAQYVIALVLREAGDGQAALDEFEAIQAALEQNPDARDAMQQPFLNKNFGHDLKFDLAQAAYDAGDTATTLGYLEQAIQEDEWWPYPYALKGQILVEQGDLAGGREAYLKALDSAGDDEELKATVEKALADLIK